MNSVVNFLVTNSLTTGVAHGLAGAFGIDIFYDDKLKDEDEVSNGITNVIHAYVTLRLVNNALAASAGLAARVGVGSISLWFAAVPLTAILLHKIAKSVAGKQAAVKGVNQMQKAIAWALTAVSVASVVAAAIGGQWLFAGTYALILYGCLNKKSQENEKPQEDEGTPSLQ